MGYAARHESGLIAVIAGELGRYNSFPFCLAHLQAPKDTSLAIKWVCGVGIAKNRNAAMQAAKDASLDWVWMLDDDHTFGPDTLQRLLAHQQPIVSPLILSRHPPHQPVMYHPRPEGSTLYPYRYLNGESGLLNVPITGTGGLLLRREVWQQLNPPWFEAGQVGADELAEDLYFCEKAAAAGLAIHVDLDTPMGHSTPIEVWPARAQDGTWITEIRFPGKASYLVDAAQDPAARIILP